MSTAPSNEWELSYDNQQSQLNCPLHCCPPGLIKLMPCAYCVQLETVYVLEGLGPPKEQNYGQKSFSDQVDQPLIHLNI